jgi:cation transport regulator
MPYSSNSDLPEAVKNNLPAKAQSIFRAAFNSSHASGKSEESSFKIGWSAVRNAGYKKDKSGNWIKKMNIVDIDELKTFIETDEGKKVLKSLDSHVDVFKASVEVTGVDESLGIVFGWGMVTEVNDQPYYDLDNQHIPDDLMVKSTSDFMVSARVSNDMHTPVDIGMVVHSFPLSKDIAVSMGVSSVIKGWMVGVKPTPAILAKFISGEYTGFSIEGEGTLKDDEETN